MLHRRLYILMGTAGLLILIVCGIALALPQPAKAQCGSQASSCKNCHETQAKDPVNTDGTGWHQSHAFGDFCYICHAGNNQATDKDAAHAGMVAPLSDVQAACAQCHPNDLQARAEVYAKVLNVQVGTGGSAQSTVNSALASAASTATPVAVAPAAPAASVPANDANLVDYVQRYNENALGQHPTNWGNVIFLVILAALVLGGGFLVARREGWVRVSFKDTKPVTGEYPEDVVGMVPELAKLKPSTRQSLRRLLDKPQAASDLLSAIDRLSPPDPGEEDK